MPSRITTPSSATRADAQSRQSAQQQLTQLASDQKAESADGKLAYKQAVDEYRKGLWKQARADFMTAQQLGYTGGFLQASPSEYLQKMDQKEQKYLAKNKKGDGRTEYERAREEYRSGDLASARADFIKARDLGFQPNYLEGMSPSEYLARMDDSGSADAQSPAPAPSAGSNISGSANASAQTVNLADDSSTQAAPALRASSSDESQLQHQAEIDRLAEQQRIFKAQGDVDVAKKLESEGNDSEALSRYTEAVDLDPTNTAAVQGRDRLLAKLGRSAESGRRHPHPHRGADQAGDAGHSVQVQHCHRSGAAGHSGQFFRGGRERHCQCPGRAG